MGQKIQSVVSVCKDALQRAWAKGIKPLGWLRASTAIPQILSREVIYMVGRKTWIEGHSHRLSFQELILPWRQNDCFSQLTFSLIYCMLSNMEEKAMVPHSSTLAWKIPWTEEPGRLQSMGSHRIGHD